MTARRRFASIPLSALVMALLAAAVRAQSCPPGSVTGTLTKVSVTPTWQPPWSAVSQPVPQFALPTAILTRVDITVACSASVAVSGENSSSAPCDFAWTIGSACRIDMPIGPPVFLAPTASGIDSLAAFDGVADGRGTSGFGHALLLQDQAQRSITDPALLARVFTGTGSVAFASTVDDASSHSGCGGLLATFTNHSWVTITLTYTYCQSVDFVSSCAGDGTMAAACPCGNFGQPGHGCENSASTGGALLSATGAVGLDTVVLTSSGELPTSTSIFLQASTVNASGAPFGDGVRCIGGTIRRLYVKSASAGIASAPGAGDPSITSRSASLGDPLLPGSLRTYQVHYRDDDTGFCPPPQGNAFNVSSAVAIVW